MNTLTNDIRYQLHLLLYTRLDTIWTLLSTVLCILVPVLLANLELPILIGTGCLWLVSMALGAFVTRRTRKNVRILARLVSTRTKAQNSVLITYHCLHPHQLDLMLERSVAQANSFFMDHNLMLGVMNVGGLLSRTKLIVPMLYFDTSQCRVSSCASDLPDAQEQSDFSQRAIWRVVLRVSHETVLWQCTARRFVELGNIPIASSQSIAQQRYMIGVHLISVGISNHIGPLHSLNHTYNYTNTTTMHNQPNNSQLLTAITNDTKYDSTASMDFANKSTPNHPLSLFVMIVSLVLKQMIIMVYLLLNKQQHFY